MRYFSTGQCCWIRERQFYDRLNVSSIYLAKYIPLVSTAAGRKAVDRYRLPPFIDGSCRREPDLQSRYPSITSLCREKFFAPNLQVGDTVVYMTVNRRFGTSGKQRRLVAILKAIKRLGSHDAAAEWYRRRSLPVPSNCMVVGNRPEPLRRTLGAPGSCACGAGTLAAWDRHYLKRARDSPSYLICCGSKELNLPPIIDNGTAQKILRIGKRVRQQYPLTLSAAELKAFRRIAKK
jgi:hypothetical protein